MIAVCQDTDPQQNVSRANRIGVYVLYPEVRKSTLKMLAISLPLTLLLSLTGNVVSDTREAKYNI